MYLQKTKLMHLNRGCIKCTYFLSIDLDEAVCEEMQSGKLHKADKTDQWQSGGNE